MEIGLGAREAVSTQQIDETAMFQTISFIQSQIPRSCDNFAWATDRTSNLARQIMTGRITFEQGNIILESELIQAKNGEIGKLQIIYNKQQGCECHFRVKFREREFFANSYF